MSSPSATSLLGTALPLLVNAATAEAAAVAALGALPLLRGVTAAPPFALDATEAAMAAECRGAALVLLPETGGDATAGLLCCRAARSPEGIGRAVAAGADALLLEGGSEAETLALLQRAREAAPFLPLLAGVCSPERAAAALEAGAAALRLDGLAAATPDLLAVLPRPGRNRLPPGGERQAAALRANLRRRKAVARPVTTVR